MSFSRCVLLFSLVLTACAESQAYAFVSPSARDSIAYRAEVKRMFIEALRNFEAQEYGEAADLFGKIVRQYPSSHRVTASYVMGAKALFRLGDYSESVRFLEALRGRFPESMYLDEAALALGLNYSRMGRFHDAASEFLDVLQTSSQEKQREQAESMLEFLASSRLSVDDLRFFLKSAEGEEIRAYVSFLLAQKVATGENVHEAIEILQPFASVTLQSPFVRKAQVLLQRLQQSGVVQIGVLLPLMQESAPLAGGDVGRDLLEGICFAVERHNAEHLPKVNLDVRDSERDPSVTARQMTAMSEREDILAILGPVFSNQVFASAGIANARGIPIITPTATSNGIAAIGPFVFQANPDYDIRGRAMAQFAIEKLQAKRLAVVAPVDAVGKFMAESFVQEARELGVELLETQWYQSGATDLRTQLSTLREQALRMVEPVLVNFAAKMKNVDLMKMLQWGVPQKRIDSLVERGATVPVEFLFGADGKRIADSLMIPTKLVPIKYDSLAIPVQNIDAIFLPIAHPDEIGIVTSQIKYFNFQTQLLGTGDWQDVQELDQNRQYADGVIFSTDYAPDLTGERFVRFVAEFQKFSGRVPSKSAVLGFDAMELVLDVLREGASTRKEVTDALAGVKDFIGHHSKITFNEARVNSILILLQFKNRSLLRIGEIDVTHRKFTP